MLDALDSIFAPNPFMPYGSCYLWQTKLISLHAVSDLFMALAYYAIPIMLLSVLARRRELPFQNILILFSLFMLTGGTIHLLAVWNLWHSAYWLTGVAKAITAALSITAAFELYCTVPDVLNLPSPGNLEATNQALETQIAERKKVEANLRKSAMRLQQALEFEALLKRITDRVRDTLDEEYILQAAVQELGKGLEALSCNAALYDLKTKTAIVHYEYVSSTVPVQGRVISMENSPHLYDQLLAGQYFQFCSLYPNPNRGRVAMLACPILDDKEILGDVWLVNAANHAFRDPEIRLLQQVANQCAIAIRQARLYQATKAQVQELQRLNQMKDDFLSTVSHELRTPVANIKLATRMLSLMLEPENCAETSGMVRSSDGDRSDASSEKARYAKTAHYLKILQDECQREIGLINDLLDLQRLESNRTTLTIEPIDLDEWLMRVVKPFDSRASSRQQTLVFETTETPLPIVYTDSVCLGRILTELINNACKYTPPGENIVVAAMPDTDKIHFEIRNSGVEIPAHELPLIFDKFYRVPSTDPWKQGGTGLGLALVQKLTECLNGDIQVRSENKLTCFTVTIPLALELHESSDQSEEMTTKIVDTVENIV